MSGHSKWSQIKHKKGVTDQKKAKMFSKISRAITLAAKEKGSDSSSNSKLRLLMEKAKEVNMPSDNIERAIKKGIGADEAENLEEAVYEAYGPGGAAIIIEAITGNKNRTLNEIKHILNEHSATLGTPGSVIWAFEKKDSWEPKHILLLEKLEDREKLLELIEELENHDDIQNVSINASLD